MDQVQLRGLTTYTARKEVERVDQCRDFPAKKTESTMKNCRYAHSEVLLWTLAGIIVSCSCFHSSSENRDYWELNFDQLFGNSKRQIEDGFVNSMVKLVHFFIARCLQFRYLPALQHGSSMYMLFWVAFTLSISSLSVDL